MKEVWPKEPNEKLYGLITIAGPLWARVEDPQKLKEIEGEKFPTTMTQTILPPMEFHDDSLEVLAARQECLKGYIRVALLSAGERDWKEECIKVTDEKLSNELL